MSKIFKHKKRISFISLLTGSLLLLGACGALNNPFNPSAQLKVLSIEGEREVNRGTSKFQDVGIFQFVETKRDNVTNQNTTEVLYEFVDPKIKIQNNVGLPRVTFTKGVVRYKLSGLDLPLKEFPINQTLGVGSATGEDMIINMVGIDSDLRKAVFPGDSLPVVEEGSAELVLIGQDFNRNPVRLEIPISLRFFSNKNVNTLFPGATPTPAPTATPIGTIPASSTTT